MDNGLNSWEFAQLLASRICHDLISPVAAVNNGIELLAEGEEDEESQKYALELIGDSAFTAAMKLKLMRAAFGAGQSLPNNCSQKDLAELWQDLAKKNKINISWVQQNTEFFASNQARLILNIMMVLLEALPRGGNITLETQDQTINFVVSSEKLIFSDEKLAYLNGQEKIPSEPRYIGFMIIRHLARDANLLGTKLDNNLTISLSHS